MSAKKLPIILSQLNVAMAHRSYFRRNNLRIIKSTTYIQRLKITILGANWQLFRLERIAKFSFNFVYAKHQVLLIYNENNEICVANLIQHRLFPLGNKYLGVFVLNGLVSLPSQCETHGLSGSGAIRVLIWRTIQWNSLL